MNQVPLRFKLITDVQNLYVPVRKHQIIDAERETIENNTKSIVRDYLDGTVNMEVEFINENKSICLMNHSTDSIKAIGVSLETDTLKKLNNRIADIENARDKWLNQEYLTSLRVLIERAREYYWNLYSIDYYNSFNSHDLTNFISKYSKFNEESYTKEELFKPNYWSHFVKFVKTKDQDSGSFIDVIKGGNASEYSNLSDNVHLRNEIDIADAVRNSKDQKYIKLFQVVFNKSV
mmetsp:Transcript_22647/g.20569  ORF Transcript_22647/g.20569 Transcript_22647/m.20569 type:complete len:234 (-) Transcript_22647:69-770(-)